jgi:hypothetical protein
LEQRWSATAETASFAEGVATISDLKPGRQLEGVITSGDARTAGEANVFIPFAHFRETCRQLAAALKNIDLERQAAATRTIIQHVLQRRVGISYSSCILVLRDLEKSICHC